MRQVTRRRGRHRQVSLLAAGRCGLATIAAAVLIGCPASVPALSQSFVETYATVRACESGQRLSDEECHNAFANAQAELDEGTPRFSARAECESVFRHCMIAGFVPGSGKKPALIFEPTMRAVEVHLRSSSDRTVIPLIEGNASGLTFEPRSITRPDTAVSASHRAQVQATWLQRLPTAAPNGTAADNPSPDSSVSAPDLPKPAAQVPAADPAIAVQRKRQLQALPFVP